MRRISAAILAAGLTLGACQSITSVDGFDAAASRGEVVSIDGRGVGRSGRFVIAPLGTAGTFKRSAQSRTVNGDKLAIGDLAFSLVGGEFDGWSAECAHSRETFEISEQVSRRTTLGASYLTGPYVLTCGFYRDGEPLGGIAMHEEVGGSIGSARSGGGEVGPARMRVTSLHSSPGLAIPSGSPLGYAMDFADGGEAVLFANGFDRRVALPRTGRDERAAALLSGIVLSLVWDPGDD